MSRGDSTLRGHYPLETQVLRDVLSREGQQETDGEVICPFFKEGGRFTIGNIHYVRYGRELVPAGETEFAADRTFGYRSSNLADYVEEKTKGAYPAGEVICIGLDDLRHGRVDKVAGQLMEVRNFNKVIVNAVDYGDLKVFALALYEAMGEGKRFLFRTAASLVKVMGGITDQPFLPGRRWRCRRTDTVASSWWGRIQPRPPDSLWSLKRYPEYGSWNSIPTWC